MLIRNIWAIGRNFKDHVDEMKLHEMKLQDAKSPDVKPKTGEISIPAVGGPGAENRLRSDPLVFLKAGSCASVNSNQIQWPDWAQEVHHEVEFAFKLNSHLQLVEAAVALDLTERKIQSEAKKLGTPWTLSKSFSGACAISSFFILRSVSDLKELEIKLWVNGELRQEGKISDMIYSPQEFLDYLLERFPLCPGDILLTGTPGGVGPLHPQDLVLAQIPGLITHQWVVQEPYKTGNEEEAPPTAP